MEWLENTRDTIAKRVKGAFGGTFLIIWSVFNWRILYILFNFDSSLKLNEKLLIIDTYILKNYPRNLLLYPIIFSLVSVITYSILNHITYVIITFFNLIVKPFILRLIDKNTVIEKYKYQELQSQYFDLTKKYDTEKKEFLENTKKTEQLILDNNRLNVEIESISKNYIDTNNLVKVKDEEIFNLKNNTIHYKTEVAPSVLFPGLWLKSYKEKDKTIGSERFSISENKYFINDQVYFEISSIKLNQDQNFLELKKISTIDNRLIVDRLIKVSDNLYFGIENEDIVIKYVRIDHLSNAEIINLENSPCI
jgi:hypothetical protein